MLHHEGLVHFVLQRQARCGMAYDDLAQEGRLALWKAVLDFDPHRGTAFSTLAVQLIRYRMWRAITVFKRQRRELPLPEWSDPLQVWEETRHWAEVRTALVEAVSRLPDNLREIIIARYGLDGQPRRTFKALGQHYGVTMHRISNLCNDALVLLRLPAYSSRLRSLCGQDSRAAYARTRALTRKWFQMKYRWKRL